MRKNLVIIAGVVIALLMMLAPLFASPDLPAEKTLTSSTSPDFAKPSVKLHSSIHFIKTVAVNLPFLNEK